MTAPGRLAFMICDIGFAALLSRHWPYDLGAAAQPGGSETPPCSQRAPIATQKSKRSLCYIMYVDIRVLLNTL